MSESELFGVVISTLASLVPTGPSFDDKPLISRCSFPASESMDLAAFTEEEGSVPPEASSEDKQKPLLQSEFAKFPTWADLAYQGD